MGEAGTLHRDEPSGTLHGLLRVRHITQDDAHIFCTMEQVEDEVLGCLDYAYFLYGLFDLAISVDLSTRPENRLGDDADWDRTEAALTAALERQELDYVVNEGDGAFYGPKIDLHMEDALGRAWQLGTIQLDFQMPQRFGLGLRWTRQCRAPAGDDPPGIARLPRAIYRHPARAHRRRPSRLARAGAGPADTGG